MMKIEIDDIITIQNFFNITIVILIVGMFIWYKKRKIYYIVIGFLIFLWLPYIIDFLIIGRIKTNITNVDTWLGFMGSYLGSGLGAGITLIGVFYQLDFSKKLEEKNRLSGFISYLNYSLKNISSNKIIFEEIENNKFFETNKESFYEISEKFLQENMVLLFSIGKFEAEKVLNFFLEVFNYNNKCVLFSNNKTKDILLNELNETLEKIGNEVDIKNELYNMLLKIKSIFMMLNLLTTYKWILNTEKNNRDEKIKKNIDEIIVGIIKDIREIQNFKYIKRRKTFSFFNPIDKKKIECPIIFSCYYLRILILEKENTEEKIFLEINYLQEMLVTEFLNMEDYSFEDNSIFLKLEERKKQLLKIIKLEKEIINDKKRILSSALDLAKDLEKYI